MCGIGRRCSSDLAFLWLWLRLVAIALIRPLAWEPPYAAGAALENGKKTKKKKKKKKKNLTSLCEDASSIPVLAQWVKDPVFLWLWRRLAATAPIRPLAWEPPYAAGAAQEIAKRPKKQKKKTINK